MVAVVTLLRVLRLYKIYNYIRLYSYRVMRSISIKDYYFSENVVLADTSYLKCYSFYYFAAGR